MTSHADYPRLAHDIGKHLVRAAKNLGPAPVPAAVAAMLVRDLYEAPMGGRPAQSFEALAGSVDTTVAAHVRALFAQVDALEPGVRAHDEVAMRRAAALAIEISETILHAGPRS